MTKITIKNKSGDTLKTLDIDSGKVLLKQLEEAGVEIPNACRMGMCAACMCHIESGESYAVKDLRGEPAFPLGDNEIMTCIGGFQETDKEIILQTLY